eukprot:gene30462-35473_t
MASESCSQSRKRTWSETETPPANEPLTHGLAKSIGGRPYMEDYHAILLEHEHEAGATTAPLQGHSLFMVADGHGGPKVAQHLSEHLPRCVAEEMGLAMASRSTYSSMSRPLPPAIVQQALMAAYLRTDASIPSSSSHESGSTAVTALVSSSHVILANCGDSRAVLSRGGVAVALTQDHSPDRKDEQARVTAAGGLILNHNGLRVMGVLNMTRALGDSVLRKYGVIPDPDVYVEPIQAEDDFLILASDGVWCAMSNQEAVDVIKLCISRAISKGADLESALRVAARILVRTAADVGSKDNVTVIVVDLSTRAQARVSVSSPSREPTAERVSEAAQDQEADDYSSTSQQEQAVPTSPSSVRPEAPLSPSSSLYNGLNNMTCNDNNIKNNNNLQMTCKVALLELPGYDADSNGSISPSCVANNEGHPLPDVALVLGSPPRRESKKTTQAAQMNLITMNQYTDSFSHTLERIRLTKEAIARRANPLQRLLLPNMSLLAADGQRSSLLSAEGLMVCVRTCAT